MKKYGVKWLCYEAGPDTFGPEHIQAKKASQLDPRMEQIMVKYWRTWRSGGGELMNYFIAGATNYDTQYGTWGLQTTSPRPTPPRFVRSTPSLTESSDLPSNPGVNCGR
jgi:hypothetical protein